MLIKDMKTAKAKGAWTFQFKEKMKILMVIATQKTQLSNAKQMVKTIT